MAGRPKSRERRVNWERLKADPGFLDRTLEAIAQGESLYQWAEGNTVAYTTLVGWLSDESSGRASRYAHARQLRAAANVERIEAIAASVERDDGIDPQRARVAAENRRWLAARMDPHLWGDRQTVDMKVSGTVEHHVAAIRELAQRGRQGVTYDNDGSESDSK